MNKEQKTAEPSANRRLAVMAGGGLLALALIGWALTRNVDAPVSTVPSEPLSTTAATPPVPATSPITATTPPQSADDRAAVARMGVAELKQKLDRGEVTLVDVRDMASFSASHIPGALHIPFSRIEAEVDSLPKSKPLVLYCT